MASKTNKIKSKKKENKKKDNIIKKKSNKKIIEEYSFNKDDLTEIIDSSEDASFKTFSSEKKTIKNKLGNNKPISGEIKNQLEFTNKIEETIKKRGRPKKNPENNEIKKVKVNEKLTEEEKLLKLQLIEKYKKYRSTFEFKRKEVPENLSLAELQYEIEQLQNELDGNGSLVAAQVLLLTSFNLLEHASKALPLGLKLDGLSEAAATNKSQFDKVLNELMIKYNLFSTTCEMRFAMLVAQTVFQVHSMNKRREQQNEKMKNIDPIKLQELQEKYRSI